MPDNTETCVDDTPINLSFINRFSEILSSLCNRFLPMNVSSILYLMNYEKYGRSTASAQYFLQLAGYLGIPVIAWNADNSGLERVSFFFFSHFPSSHYTPPTLSNAASFLIYNPDRIYDLSRQMYHSAVCFFQNEIFLKFSLINDGTN